LLEIARTAIRPRMARAAPPMAMGFQGKATV
jgi:hypothetical protein